MASETGSEALQVEVVYALPDRQELLTVAVEAGTTVQQAIEKSLISELFPGCDFNRCQVGIWGRMVDRERPVRHGDRIELYRELLIDPRNARRTLATAGRTMGRGRV